MMEKREAQRQHRSDVSVSARSGMSSHAEDRSMTIHTTLTPLVRISVFFDHLVFMISLTTSVLL